MDYASYANDTTLYVGRQNYAEATEFLQLTINNIFAWLKNNGIVANSGKTIFLVGTYEKISLKILGSTIEFGPSEELLGVTNDSELTFHKRKTSLCSKLIINLVPWQE